MPRECNMGVVGHCCDGLSRYLALAEGGILFVSVYIALYLRIGMDPASLAAHDVGAIWPDALTFTLAMLGCMTATGLYNPRLRERLEGITIRLLMAMLMGTLILSAFYYLFLDLFLGRGVLALALLCAFTGIVVLRALLGKRLERPEYQRRAVVLGAGQNAASVLRLRRRTDLIGLYIVGFIPVAGDDVQIPAERQLTVDGGLADWAGRNAVDEIVVAPDERRQTLDMAELMSCSAAGVLVTDVNSFIERETGCLSINRMTPGWFAFSKGIHSPPVAGTLKRGFDIAVSLVVLLLALPLIVGAALALWLESGRRGPILYRQVRVGHNGEPFQLLKFRSMCEDAEKPGEARWAERNDPRVTPVGRVLRRFRIDELPQLLNILRGDMSFVGPRPERPEFVGRLSDACPHYRDRHRVKPGLTGWAQIRYPYGATEADAFRKLEFDLFYVKNRNLLYLDLLILLQTAEVVLWGRGVR